MRISIHTLCEEGDVLFKLFDISFKRFQSTPSVKRVTCRSPIFKKPGFISIHTLCEEGDGYVYNNITGSLISIHTLCEEGDKSNLILLMRVLNFNPHPL